MTDLVKIIKKNYVEKIIDVVGGMKALIVDNETIHYISVIYSQTQILEKGVYLVEPIGSSHERMDHLTAIYFVRPTVENIEKIKKELSQPLYAKYIIIFSNICPQVNLEDLAASDKHNLVHVVREYYLDYYALSPSLFSIENKHPLRLLLPRAEWRKPEEFMFNREVQAVISSLLALKLSPIIRYDGYSPTSQLIAENVKRTIDQDDSLGDLFRFQHENPPILIIFDRRNDPVTPLLLQWTYQAMIHELLRIVDNKVDLSHVPNIHKDAKTVVLTMEADPFYANHLYDNFGDLGTSIKRLADEYKVQNEANSNLENMDDIQRFLETYGDFKKLSISVTKNLAMVTEMAKMVDVFKLMEVSELQQEIIADLDQIGHFKRLKQLFKSPNVRGDDLLRTSMLYCIKYDGKVAHEVKDIKKLLEGKEVEPLMIELLDHFIEFYRGSHNPDLFNKNAISNVLQGITKGIKGGNVYTQHRPLIIQYLEQLKNGKLKESTFPIIRGQVLRGKVQDVVIYIVGGATYEESFYINEFNKNNPGINVTLGGSTILNSVGFLSAIQNLTKPSQ